MHGKRWISAFVLSVLVVLLIATGCGREEPAQSANAGGPEPNFSNDSLYVSIDDFKHEYDRGANMVILDARPEQDYELDHIEGAISMPFFEVEERYEELPRDTWIVTYCACPRAEAEEAASVLQDNGFEKVKVLYDGYFAWLSRDYPIASASES